MSGSASSPNANPTPSWLDTGDNAWQLTAATFVGLQSIPGLMVLYAGIVKKKWAINSALMVLYAYSAVLICWVAYAYKAGFGNRMLPFVSIPGSIVGMDWELRQAELPAAGLSANYPLSTMVYFQHVFAVSNQTQCFDHPLRPVNLLICIRRLGDTPIGL